MRFLIACLLLIAMTPAVVKAADVPPLLQGVHRIVCLGDSITQGGEGPGGYVWLVRHYLAALYPQQPIDILPTKDTCRSGMFQKSLIPLQPA